MNIFNRDKKGFLLAEETLKIIIAVICIIFLVYILITIYNANASPKKIEDAKDSLSRIDAIISALGEGETQTQDIPAPDGWHLYSFVGQEKPNSCLNENCLCICANSLITLITSQAKKCDKEGACLVVSKLAMSQIDLKITGADNLLFIQIKKQNGKIFVEEKK